MWPFSRAELQFIYDAFIEYNVSVSRYFKLLIQEFNIKLDKGFIMSLYDIFASLYKEQEEVSFAIV